MGLERQACPGARTHANAVHLRASKATQLKPSALPASARDFVSQHLELRRLVTVIFKTAERGGYSENSTRNGMLFGMSKDRLTPASTRYNPALPTTDHNNSKHNLARNSAPISKTDTCVLSRKATQSHSLPFPSSFVLLLPCPLLPPGSTLPTKGCST